MDEPVFSSFSSSSQSMHLRRRDGRARRRGPSGRPERARAAAARGPRHPGLLFLFLFLLRVLFGRRARAAGVVSTSTSEGRWRGTVSPLPTNFQPKNTKALCARQPHARGTRHTHTHTRTHKRTTRWQPPETGYVAAGRRESGRAAAQVRRHLSMFSCKGRLKAPCARFCVSLLTQRNRVSPPEGRRWCRACFSRASAATTFGRRARGPVGESLLL